MSRGLYVNAVPALPQAPVQVELLRENVLLFLERLLQHKADHYILLLDRTEQALIDTLQEAAAQKKQPLRVVPVDGAYGMLYSNRAAAAKAAQGKSPTPTETGADDPVYTVEEILGCEQKTVYVCAGDKAQRVTLDKSCRPSEILRSAGVEGGVKAIVFGYPMGLVLESAPADMEAVVDIYADSIHILQEKECALQELLAIANTYLSVCCGQCVFGYEGLSQIQMIAGDIANKKGNTADLERIAELAAVMETQSLCDIGRIAATAVSRLLAVLEPEIKEHITRKNCPAGVCRKFVSYHILPDLCVGCTDCQDECEDDAIAGKKNFVHVIDQDECSQCGQCLAVCAYGAIVTAGKIKPKTPKKPIRCTARA